MNNARPHHQSSASGGRRGFRPAFVDDLAFNSWGVAYFVLATIVKATGLWQHMHDEIHLAFLQGEVAYRKALLEYCELMGPSLMMHLPGVFEDAEIKGCPRISRLIKDLNGEDYFERLEAERIANERQLIARFPDPVRSEEANDEKQASACFDGCEPPKARSDVSKTIGTEDTPNTWISRRSFLPPQSGRCWGTNGLARTRVVSALFYSPLWSAPARNLGLTGSGPDPPATTGSHLWQKSYMSPALLCFLPHT